MNHRNYLLPFLFAILSFHKTEAQAVPVIKEPHHNPVLVNEYVRLLDVHINPGDTTLYHIHQTASVIVPISKTTTGIQKWGEAPGAPSTAVPGNVAFVHFETAPVTHRVFNADNNVYHVMDIELVKKEPSPDSCAALQQSSVETPINEKLVRVYKFDVSKTSPMNVSANSCAHLLVCISGELNAGSKHIKTGDYIFYNPNTPLNISNQQTENASCVLLELK